MNNTLSTSTKKIYCFDTSAFVTLSRTSENIINIPEELWNHLDEMVKDGGIISHRTVFEEIVSKSKKPDLVSAWLLDKEKYFRNKTQFQIDTVLKIISNFPDLIDSESEHEQADPWIIALAIEKTGEDPLFGEKKVAVVSQENKRSTKKMPAVCEFFRTEHLSLRDFFQEIGLGIKLIKNKEE